MNETENQTRLRRAKEALELARDQEAMARKALADATKSRELAKERYEQLFMAEEKAAAARLQFDYRHTTK